MSSPEETAARMLLTAFQTKALKGSLLRCRLWQTDTVLLVQCQKDPVHSLSVPEAAHKCSGCRTDHHVGKGKDWNCLLSSLAVLTGAIGCQPRLKQGSAIPPCSTSTTAIWPNLGFQSLKHRTPCLDFCPWCISQPASILPLNTRLSPQCLQQHYCSRINGIKPVSITNLTAASQTHLHGQWPDVIILPLHAALPLIAWVHFPPDGEEYYYPVQDLRTKSTEFRDQILNCV